MIFKLQRPLSGGGEILAYDRARKRHYVLTSNDTLLSLFGEAHKIFVEASPPVKGQVGGLVIDRVVPAQDW